METKRTIRYIRIDRDFMDLPEIEDTVVRLKGVGFAMVIFLLERLQYRNHAVGSLDNLSIIAKKLGVQIHTVIDMLQKCPVFRVDMKHRIFYAPRLRKRMGLPEELSEDDIEDVLRNGTVCYKGVAGSLKKARSSKSKSQTKSKRFEKSASQLPDNQQKCVADKDIDKDISDRNIKIESNKAQADKSSCGVVDADGGKEFKEILSSSGWLRSVEMRTGVKLSDATVLGRFASWMSGYCTSIQKRLGDAADVRGYAMNLLRKGSRTRAEFDVYLAEHQQVAPPVYTEPPHSEFEFIHHGMRFTNQGQVVPLDAPMPESGSQWFSYIHNRWVERRDYREDVENAALERIMKDNPGYVCRTGGASC